MKTKRVTIVLLLTVLSGSTATPQPPAEKAEPEKAVKQWPAKDASDIASTLIIKVREGEAEAIRYLESIPAESTFEKQNGPSEAMEFLGTIRSVKAVSVLCDHLLWEKFHKSLVGDRLQYPASAALVQIGTPAVDGVSTRVAGAEVSDRYRWVVSGILADILGKDHVLKAIDDFKITDKRTDEVEGRKRLDALKSKFKVRYGIKSVKG